jgi:hypothetical protein
VGALCFGWPDAPLRRDTQINAGHAASAHWRRWNFNSNQTSSFRFDMPTLIEVASVSPDPLKTSMPLSSRLKVWIRLSLNRQPRSHQAVVKHAASTSSGLSHPDCRKFRMGVDQMSAQPALNTSGIQHTAQLDLTILEELFRVRFARRVLPAPKFGHDRSVIFRQKPCRCGVGRHSRHIVQP